MRSHGAAELADLVAGADLVIAPTLYCAETANAFWKYVRAGTLDASVVVARCEEARSLVDQMIPDCDLQVEALAFSVQHDHPVYDGLYAVLARRHAAGVITRDQRLAKLLATVGIAVA